MAPLLATVALGLVPAVAIAAEPESGVGAPAPGATTPEEGAEDAREPMIPALTNAKSPFRANRLASKPLGLTPDQVTDPFDYPREPVILSWAGVPGAVDYEVEVAANPGFSKIMWRDTTDQTNVVPEVLLPDGQYWWRVTPIDKAKTRGLASDAARFVKAWPSGVTGLQTRATPTGGPVSFMRLNPYMAWNQVAGARYYEAQIAPADQFATPAGTFEKWAASFASPAYGRLLPDDAYRWRVRAKDPADHPGPWVTSAPFTKAWERVQPTYPADNANLDEVFLSWNDVPGADTYQVQITQVEHNFVGDALKVNATTTSTGYAPTAGDLAAKGFTPGDYWWRVRPVMEGTVGGWSIVRKGTWTLPTGGAAAPTLRSSGDSDSAYMPHLAWNPVAGANIYRVDIAADENFNQMLESVYTRSHHWVSRVALPDNQVGTGYWWRVVWGTGTTETAPALVVDEDAVPKASVRKQVRMVTAQSQSGLVQEPPLVSWNLVPGAGKYELQVSKDEQFASGEVRSNVIYGTGASPNSLDREHPLVDGTWHWRVRALDGGGLSQTWSAPRSFTLTRPRPEQAAPRNGETVVGSPRLEWQPIPQAAAYQVQLRRDRNFEQTVEPDAKKPGDTTSEDNGSAPAPEQSSAPDIQSTFQTSWTPTGEQVSKPGFWYWRVRADYGGNNYGQWTPVRSFRSIRPADFNLNSIPSKTRYGYRLTVSGKLELNGKAVKKARLNVERRFLQDPVHRVYGTVRTDSRGRFAFSLPMRASASWRLTWRDEPTPTTVLKRKATTTKRPSWKKKPKISKAALAKRYGKGAKLVRAGNGRWTVKYGKQTKAKAKSVPATTGLVRASHARAIASEDGIKGQAPFAVTVTPRVTLKLAKSRVVRNRYIKLTGSIFPKRQGLIQVLGSDGWETVKKVKPRKTRFGTRIRAKLAPGRYRIRLFVPQDKRKRLGAGKSRRSGLFVYDKFVVRKGGR